MTRPDQTKHPLLPLEVIERDRARLFEDNDPSALNNFSANLPAGYRRTMYRYVTDDMPEEFDVSKDELFLDADRVIEELGLDPEIIEAFNLALAALSMNMSSGSAVAGEDYSRIRLASTKYIFPVYERLVLSGKYISFDLCS